MRKLMLLAAVMAMVLAAAAPAFAQANAVGGTIQYADCDQIQAAATGQYNAANNQENAAGIAQELGVDENQVLACLQSIAAGRDVNINAASASASAATVTATATAGGGGGGGGGGSAAAAAGGSLPSTGGASLLALGAGALLVAGGLLARRIVR